MLDLQAVSIAASPDVIHHWGWFLAFGVILILLGVLAVWRSMAATIVSMEFFGWLLVLACAVEIAQAILAGAWSYFFAHVLAAALFGVVGVFLVRRPVIGAEVITVVMAMFFLVGGIFQLVAAVSVMPPGWGWHAFSGVVSCLLGVLILVGWPATGLWVIGLYIGISLIVTGWAWSSLAMVLHRMA
jgi:uncharacterized membrane protein HdeD (DUF308 family)